MSTPTLLFINTLGVSFTPTGGSASNLTKVTKSAIDKGIQNVTFKGDGDMFNTFEGNVSQVPSVTFEGGNMGGLIGSIAGSIGALAFKWGDARNGITTGGGGISWVLSNAIVSDGNGSSPHAQIASGSLTFSSFSSDGTTNPLAMTIL